MTVDYQIIATLGPHSADEVTWRAMLAAGVTGFRLNTSHLSPDELHAWLERLEPFLDSFLPRPELTLDLQGSKWRLGQFPPITLRRTQRVTLALAVETSQPGLLPVPHPDFFQAALLSSPELAIDDARLLLRVEQSETDRMTARVIRGGRLLPRKGLTYLHSAYRQEQLQDKDRLILQMTSGRTGLRYALSYLRDAAEMAAYRTLFGPQALLVAKLERQPALDDALPIAELSDEVWLCRGDLGAELGLRQMAEQTARFTRLVKECPKPVLLAGQVLEHMTAHAIPTRAEVCALHDALSAGYAGVVLSDETAIGRHPLAACQAAALFRN
jgi:pyruvate kinase